MATGSAKVRTSWLVWVAVALLLYSAICLGQAPFVAARRRDLPRMTCDELVQRNGPGASAYIVLTDARLASDQRIARRDALSPGDLEALVPLYSAARGQEPPPGDMRLILSIRDDRDRARLLEQPAPAEIVASVRRAEPELDAWAKQGLRQSYPGLPIDRCWLVIVGVHEPSEGRQSVLHQHGVAALLAALLLVGWLAWRSRRQGSST